jgi:HlyD family secretion protein
MKKLFVLFLLVALGAVAGALWTGALSFGHETVTFRTEKVQRQDIHATVSATGTIEPEEVVDVGAQVLGKIVELGKDLDNKDKPVDHNSRVKKGMLLAKIDPDVYKAKVTQAEAALAQADANVIQTEAKLHQTANDWRRAKQMVQRNAIGAQEADAAEAAYETTKASLAVNVAAVKVAKANLEEAQTNFAYTKIVSPIDGIIVDRRVNVGQTVVAALNAPSLFLIAKDLKNMVIWASVNEADIALVQKSKLVTFTVPNDTTKYKGKVAKVRLNATMSSGVVTYPVDVSFDNSEANLLPYLTASIQFEWAEAKNVLTLPNSVLRWRPQVQNVAREKRAEWGPKLRKRNQEGDKTALQVPNPDPNRKFVVVWVEDGKGFVEPREVEIGLTDGVNTEIKGGLKEDDKVVAGIERTKDESKGLFLEGIGKMKQGGQ